MLKLLVRAIALSALVTLSVSPVAAHATRPGVIWTGTGGGGPGVYAADLSGANSFFIAGSGQWLGPALSPDGDRIAYDRSSALHVAPVNGGASSLVYSAPTGTSAQNPAWSPDGQRLLFERHSTATGQYDIYSVKIDGTDLRPVIEASDNQFAPTYSRDGQLIAYYGPTTKGNQIFVANSDGTNQRQVTQQVRNVLEHASSPRFSPDGTELVFAGKMPPSSKSDTFRDDEYEIFTINVDGTGLQRLTFDSQWDTYPDWSPDGSPIMFTRRRPLGSASDIYRINPDGTGLAVVSGGFSNAARPTYRPTGTDARAAQFRPHLRFDDQETYRPLDVDLFFGERNDAGGPLHQICGASCTSLSSKADLPQDSGSYIDIAGDGNADNYHSPYAACTDGILRDCDSGQRSAIYYHTTPDPGAGSYYVDYWFFYRYNDWIQTPDFDHEGDWESVTVASSGSNPTTFDFASFSQHGTWFSYLRENLSCDGAGPGTCGTSAAPSGQRLDVYPSQGSHANYPDMCDNREIQLSCPGSTAIGQDGNRNGRAPWGNDSSDGALIPLPSPAAPQSWSGYPGRWGAPYDSGPSGPAFGANGTHFWNPASSQCAEGNDNCGARTSRVQARTAAKLRDNDRCETWFGAGVAAAACAPARLRAAVAQRRVRGEGTFRLRRIGGARASVAAPTGSAPGIAQAMGGALRPGQRMQLVGDVPRGAELLVRAAAGRRSLHARYTKLGREASAGATVKAGRDKTGRPTLVLRTRTGKVVRPEGVQRQRLRRLKRRT